MDNTTLNQYVYLEQFILFIYLLPISNQGTNIRLMNVDIKRDGNVWDANKPDKYNTVGIVREVSE